MIDYFLDDIGDVRGSFVWAHSMRGRPYGYSHNFVKYHNTYKVEKNALQLTGECVTIFNMDGTKSTHSRNIIIDEELFILKLSGTHYFPELGWLDRATLFPLYLPLHRRLAAVTNAAVNAVLGIFTDEWYLDI